MNSPKTSGTWWRIWLAGGVLMSLLLAAFIHGVPWRPSESLPFPDLDAQFASSEEFAPAVSVAPEVDVEQLSESLERMLGSHLEEESRRNLEAFKESLLAQGKKSEEWHEGFDRKVDQQFSRLERLEQRLHSLERGVNQLLGALEDEAQQSSMEPVFTFRGVEIWHGQTYALLEHEGRILSARQGESRLGWRIHAIDRGGRKLHVSDGVTELVLEEQ